MRRLPAWLSTLTKITVAAVLIAWMLRRGALDLSAVGSALTRWPLILLMAGIYYLQLGLIAWRWSLLLGAQNIPFPLRDAFSLTMIGMLFNLIMPSSIGGDLMKSYYVHQRAKERSPEALTTIVLDRVLGLLSLFFVAALAALPSLLGGTGSAALPTLSLFSVLGAVGGVAALGIGIRAGRSAGGIEHSNRLVRLLVRGAGSLGHYWTTPSVLAAATAAGMLSFVLSCLNFSLAARAVGVVDLPIQFLFLVPLGLLTTALPISPAGIGVGQVAFAELFRLASGGAFTFGANAFTVFQTVQFLVNLTGFFFYVSYRNPATSRP